MSNKYREQQPLLNEGSSEEESFNTQFHKHYRPMNKGRARSHIKGAAAIISRWPDHWSSFVIYWWVGLGMISITTFILYNSLFSLVAPATNQYVNLPEMNIEKTSKSLSKLPEIFMHVFINNEEIDFNKYVPYIKIVSNNFTDFKYNLIVVFNDSHLDDLSDVRNNEIALNDLWSYDSTRKIVSKDLNNIHIHHITLSALMNDSPLKKYWRRYSYRYIPFLVRAISIWERGGIAFNPDILTSRSPHSSYIVKLQAILEKYLQSPLRNDEPYESKKIFRKGNKFHRKVNNIRDIIDALEQENDSNYVFPQSLAEAENKKTATEISFKQKEDLVADKLASKYNKSYNEQLNISAKNDKKVHVENMELNTGYLNDDNMKSKNDTSLFRLFSDFFHHRHSQKMGDSLERNRRSVTTQTEESSKIIEDTKFKEIQSNKPLIINTKSIPYSNKLEINDDKYQLTIDLMGNIIATKTACHAFIGTIINDSTHHDEEESLKDFIVKKLTDFCNGVFTSCMGIDVILL